jgi:hypothetical protein
MLQKLLFGAASAVEAARLRSIPALKAPAFLLMRRSV